MRILLADPPQKQQFYDISYANLGILYLISYLRYHLKDEVQVYYLEGRHTLKSHLEEIGRLKPDIYGLSFAYPIAPLAYETLNAVKEMYPRLPVVCGGPHPTSSAEDVLSKTKADICVVGEGEETLLELIRHLAWRTPSKLADVKGIAFCQADGTIVFTPQRSYINELDTIPFPAWDMINVNKYDGIHFRKSFPFGYVLANRGCPFNCTFCSNPVWKINKPWLRLRSPENVVAEVEYLYNMGVCEIWFTSDELNPNLNWAMDLCNAIAGLGHRDLYFQCQLRVDKVTDEFAAALRAMNCWMVHLGVESANQRVLDGIGKHFTLEQVEKALKIFKRHDLKVDCYMMLYQAWEEDGDLCWEIPEEVANSLRFCWRSFLKGQIHYMSWQVATPYPGSRLYDLAQRHRILVEDKIPASVWEVSLKLPGISTKQINSDVRKGILLKNVMALKSGSISLRALWRLRENIRYVVKSLFS
jgi:anaerobic magnesium-protoporphyrin IX monomethyl ester cyclase